MTTWDNGDITKVVNNFNGNFKERIYTITGVAGDTGGTLTTKFDKIESISVQVQTSAPAGYATNLVYCISGTSSVVVAYTNPAGNHTTRIIVSGT